MIRPVRQTRSSKTCSNLPPQFPPTGSEFRVVSSLHPLLPEILQRTPPARIPALLSSVTGGQLPPLTDVPDDPAFDAELMRAISGNPALCVPSLQDFNPLFLVVVFIPLAPGDDFRSVPNQVIHSAVNRHLTGPCSSITTNQGHLAVTVCSYEDEEILRSLTTIDHIAVFSATVAGPSTECLNRNQASTASASRLQTVSLPDLQGTSSAPKQVKTATASTQTAAAVPPTAPVPVAASPVVPPPAAPTCHISRTAPVPAHQIVAPVTSSSDLLLPSATPAAADPLPMDTTTEAAAPPEVFYDYCFAMATTDSMLPHLENVPPTVRQFPVIFTPLNKSDSFKLLHTIKVWNDLSKGLTSLDEIHSMQALRNGGLLFRATSQARQAELMKFTQLTKIPVKTSVPNDSVTCRGVISDIHPDTSTDFLQRNLSADGFQILNVVRLFDKNKSPTLAAITFAGVIRPRFVRCDGAQFQTRPYFEIPIQCRRCFRFAHKTTACRSKATCAFCVGLNHAEELCPTYVNAQPLQCSNCQGAHAATSPDCPARLVQNAVLRYKTKYKTSFSCAKDHIHPRGLSYSAALTRLKPLPHPPSTAFRLPAAKPSSHHRDFPSLPPFATSPNSIPVPPTQRRPTRTYASVVSPPPAAAGPAPSSVDPIALQSLLSMMTQLCQMLLPGASTPTTAPLR